MENKSEVALLMAAIQDEYIAGCRAMHGFALGSAQHLFVTKRMENMARYVGELREKYGDEAAQQAMMALDNVPDSEQQRGEGDGQ